MSASRRLYGVIAVLALLLVAAPSAFATGRQWFAPDSIWNAALPDDAPLDPRSDQYVAEFRRQAAIHPGFIATDKTSVPIYTVPGTQPRVKVTLDAPNSAYLQLALSSVPIPDDARVADGPDGNLVVWQPETDTMWEFWRMTKEVDGWHADWGGKMGNVTTNPGYYQRLTDDRGRIIQQPWWGAPAAHFPVVAGVMTLDELYAGHIDHAINFTLRDVRKGVWSWPAQATDGRNAGSQYIPQGAHFRFDPNLDLDSLDLPPMTRMIAEAVQKYGMILENSSGGIVFRAEDPKPLGIDPYYGPNRQPGDPEDLFSKWPVDLMRAFPWEHLQLLKMDLRDANGPVSE